MEQKSWRPGDGRITINYTVTVSSDDVKSVSSIEDIVFTAAESIRKAIYAESGIINNRGSVGNVSQYFHSAMDEFFEQTKKAPVCVLMPPDMYDQFEREQSVLKVLPNTDSIGNCDESISDVRVIPKEGITKIEVY